MSDATPANLSREEIAELGRMAPTQRARWIAEQARANLEQARRQALAEEVPGSTPAG